MSIYVCRSCRHALLTPSPSLSRQSTRSFSSTRHNAKVLATFEPTSSPEIDTLLSSWRSKVFLPSVLPAYNRRMLRKPKGHDILNTPPGVTVTLQTKRNDVDGSSEEQIKLEPLHPFDKPHKQTLLDLIHLLEENSKDAAAWNNVIPLLEGLHESKSHLPINFYARLARAAVTASPRRDGLIVRAAETSDRTGLTLADRGVTRELLIGIHRRAIAKHYQGESENKDLNKLATLVAKEEHGGKLTTPTQDGRVNMSNDPLLLAAHLEQAAARVLTTKNNTDSNTAKSAHNLAIHASHLLARTRELEALSQQQTNAFPYHSAFNLAESSPKEPHAILDLVLISHATELAITAATKCKLESRHKNLARDLQALARKIDTALGLLRKKHAGSTNKDGRKKLWVEVKEEAQEARKELGLEK